MVVKDQDLVPRKKRKDVTYCREKSEVYLLSSNEKLIDGPWTNAEKICLFICLDILQETDLNNVMQLYNIHSSEKILNIRVKNINMINLQVLNNNNKLQVNYFITF